MEENSLNRRQFVAVSATALMGAVAASAMSGCSSSDGGSKGSDSSSKDKIRLPMKACARRSPSASRRGAGCLAR